MADSGLLTREELDALLESVARGQVGVGDWPAATEEVLPYDLAGPENAIGPLLRILESILDRFAHQLHAALFELLRRDLEIAASAPEVRPYADFITSLSSPCSVNIIGMPPLAGPGLLVLEQPLVFVIVDTYFGGTGRQYSPASPRGFSLTETRLIQRLLGLAFRALGSAWNPYLAVNCAHLGAEINPHFVTAISPAESLVTARLSMELDELSGALHLAMPCSMFEPVRGPLLASLNREHLYRDERLARLLREGVRHSPVTASGVLAETELTLRELLSLTAGDVIPLTLAGEAVLKAEGVPLYAGPCGVAQGWRAVKIDRTLTGLEEAQQAAAQGARNHE
ncbi:MAG: FliM/FliN family flagellar motor switch protein [Pseudomonadota bacterium]|nr:FliM/FliN family flagellar motor switch protein [Pseudomonadota bacterium]